MTNAAQSVKTLIQDTAEDRKHYHVLNDLLIQQRDHIIARRAAKLDVLNVQIMACYQHLSQHSQQRYRLLERLSARSGRWTLLVRSSINAFSGRRRKGDSLTLRIGPMRSGRYI